MNHRIARAPLASLIILPTVMLAPIAAPADTITIATYNIDDWDSNFAGSRLAATTSATSLPATMPSTTQAAPATQPEAPGMLEMIDREKQQNDEDHWEVGRVIIDANFNPDILVVQEGCTQKDLEFFNRRWLNEAYGAVVQLAAGEAEHRYLNILIKPGFTILERRDRFDMKLDSPGGEGTMKPAAGPAFCLIETPTGYKFWVGTIQLPDKTANTPEKTALRNQLARRTHQIMLELSRQGPEDVILLGDMNDTIGVDPIESELKSGGDTIANLVGPAGDGFILATQRLAEQGQVSFGAYWRTDQRALIDHIVCTGSMKDQITEPKVVQNDIASVASDHFPVVIKVRAETPATQPIPASLPAVPLPSPASPQ